MGVSLSVLHSLLLVLVFQVVAITLMPIVNYFSIVQVLVSYTILL